MREYIKEIMKMYKKEGNYAIVKSEGKELVRALIYSRDLQPTYALKISNGSTGTGSCGILRICLNRCRI